MVHVDEHRGLEEVPLRASFATHQHASTFCHRVVDVVFDDVHLSRCHHRTDIAGKTVGCIHTLPQGLDFVRDQANEFVVNRRLDIDPLNTHARLTGIGHSTPHCGAGRAVEVGVGEHDERILAAELQAAGDEPLGAVNGDRTTGPDRPGEHHHVDLVDNGRTRGSATGDGEKHRRGTDLLAPAADNLGPRQRGHLRRLAGHGSSGHQRPNHVHHRAGQGAVPRCDQPDQLMGPNLDPQPTHGVGRTSWFDPTVGQELLGVLGEIVDDVNCDRHLQRCVGPRLSRLRLDHRQQPPLIVEQPVQPPKQIRTSSLRAQRFPFGLRGAEVGANGLDFGRAEIGNAAHLPSIGRAVDRDLAPICGLVHPR